MLCGHWNSRYQRAASLCDSANTCCPPESVKIKLIAERFEDTWTKLRIFELCGYDAVCYLDADMAVFGDANSIFDKKLA